MKLCIAAALALLLLPVHQVNAAGVFLAKPKALEYSIMGLTLESAPLESQKLLKRKGYLITENETEPPLLITRYTAKEKKLFKYVELRHCAENDVMVTMLMRSERPELLLQLVREHYGLRSLDKVQLPGEEETASLGRMDLNARYRRAYTNVTVELYKIPDLQLWTLELTNPGALALCTAQNDREAQHDTVILETIQAHNDDGLLREVLDPTPQPGGKNTPSTSPADKSTSEK